ncbi:hypothetical protein HPP92_000542 [Vanilla planifolia]|uniref:HMA domain-containing protein n=1 Tax=Vanilla planifolia TaxID=51239 RepID=A0A835VG39_VANPL|nr:hypothetical protein HPP92_000584 [Vanilla planifolia]KAG0500470.1 hypothetical protein HPP92_000542 [Vanilla planifolia]
MFSRKPKYAKSLTIVDMCVHMDCEGCQRKIRKSLAKLHGVDNVDIDMVRQKVTVTGYVDQKKVLRAVRKTGRTAMLWPCYGHQHHLFHNDYDSYCNNASTSSYNYENHGCFDAQAHGYHVMPSYYGGINDRVMNLFSDENPHACTIM